MSAVLECLFGGSALTPGNHLVTIGIPKNYGFVILVAIVSSFLLIWMGIQVGKVRKQFKVFYPTMYSATNDHFNCYQRAHQNTLEGYPTFLLLLLLGGLEMPVFSAIAGVVFIIGRVSYALGYHTGDRKNRMRGMYAMFGVLALLLVTLRMTLRLIF